MATKKSLRATYVMLLAYLCSCTSGIFAQTSYFSSHQGVDPVIAALDSMSNSLFTRDKFFVSDAQVVKSILLTPDQVPHYTDAQITEKMKQIPAEFPLTYNSAVKPFLETFAYKRRGLMSRCLANAQVYFPLFEEILDKHGLPLELKYLPVIESAFNPIAVSRAGATGLWQLMYTTGQMYGVHADTYVDERRDPRKATEAAAAYLKDLYKMYGDWALVLAAYNSGPGNVNKAIVRAGGIKNFWAIMHYLPAETRNYVPSFIAALYVLHYHKDFKILPQTPRYDLYAIDTVMFRGKVTLKHIASVLGIGEDELQFINPSLKRGIVPYVESGFPLNLPVKCVASFIANEKTILNDTSIYYADTEAIIAASAPKVIYYKVRKNETITQIASKHGVAVASIKKWNGLRSTKLYHGQKLKIYLPQTNPAIINNTYAQAFAPRILEKDTTLLPDIHTELEHNEPAEEEQTTENASETEAETVSTEQKPRCVLHVVQPGDTLWSISQRYQGVTVEKIKADNSHISSRPIRVGDVLKIFL
ncbi:MAG: LysM peptidoglycan-binding domain-containing protein [Chitinophagales bacterium]|nr:LysM peptidoglycan-binding domain-containing protein [Chitinophagales bacterium]